EQRAGSIGQEHALVRVERQRVGARQPFENRLRLFAQIEERTISAVDVMPHVLISADVGDRIQRIHRSRIRVPALETTQKGVSPARRSEAIASDSRSTRIRKRPSDSMTRTRSGMIPPSFADFRIEWCAWSDV